MFKLNQSTNSAQLKDNATNNSNSLQFTKDQYEVFSKILYDAISLKRINKLIAIDPINGIDAISLLLNVELGSKLHQKFNDSLNDHYFQVIDYAVPTIIYEIETLFINAKSPKSAPTKFTNPTKRKLSKTTRKKIKPKKEEAKPVIKKDHGLITASGIAELLNISKASVYKYYRDKLKVIAVSNDSRTLFFSKKDVLKLHKERKTKKPINISLNKNYFIYPFI
ncbi:hypothetical protein CMU94_02200 [Elizabethkingia anophelis]|nr:hypothetical protein [Elizabethkingia anophelis]